MKRNERKKTGKMKNKTENIKKTKFSFKIKKKKKQKMKNQKTSFFKKIKNIKNI